MSIFDGNGSNTLTVGGEGETEFFKLISLSSSKSGGEVVLTGSAGTNRWTSGLPVSTRTQVCLMH